MAVRHPSDVYTALPPSPPGTTDGNGDHDKNSAPPVATVRRWWGWLCCSRHTPPTTSDSQQTKASFRDLPNPLQNASLASRIAVSYFQPVVSLGARKVLEPEDIWRVCPEDSSAVLRDRFVRAYEATAIAGTGPTFAKRPVPRVGRALANAFRREIRIGVLNALLYLGAMTLQPFVAQAILDFLNGRENVFGLTNGYALVALMTLTSFLGVTCLNYGVFVCSRIGVNMRSMVMTTVFEKALRLSCRARQSYSTSKIMTMMSVDSDRVFNAMLYAQWLPLAPLALAVTTALIAAIYDVTAAVCGGVLLAATLYVSVKLGDRIGAAQRELLTAAQERVKVTAEALQGIRVMKFYAWEDSVATRVETIRATEVTLYRRFHWLQVANMTLLVLTPVLLGGVVLGVFVLVRGDLSVTDVYTLIAIVNISRLTVSMFPTAVAAMSQVVVSFDRLDAFLASEEIPTKLLGGTTNQVQQLSQAEDGGLITDSQHPPFLLPLPSLIPGTVSIQNASFRWTSAPSTPDVVVVSTESTAVVTTTSTAASAFRLRDVSLHIDAGSLVMIVGAVGSGKSSLLNAMLGEMILEENDNDGNDSANKTRTQSTVDVVGSVSYVAQEAWIRNASVKDNILFEDALDAARYDAVLEATQLTADLRALPHGDQTEIGERGINLSGGQKARVAIARAVYRSQYDLLILDDPLSAVDPHVAHAIFEQCILGLARHRTRVLVLNSHYDLLAHADKVVVVQDGRIVGDGAYKDVFTSFPKLLSSATLSKTTGAVGDSDGINGKVEAGGIDSVEINNTDDTERKRESSAATRATSDPTTAPIAVDKECVRESNASSSSDTDDNASKLIQAEDRVKGKVSGSTYKAYFDETGVDGVAVVACILVAFVASQSVRTLVDWWQGHWADNMPTDSADTDANYSALSFGLWYIGLIVACCVTTLARGLLLLESCIRSSKNLHDELFRRVLRAPVNTYFDVTPVGRILNRFSGDLDQMDATLPLQYQGLFQAVATFVGALVVCALASVWVGLSYVPILAVFVATGLHFKKTSREVKRLDGVSRTPVFNLFSETLNGLATIRAFDAQATFTQLNAAAVDDNASFYMAFWAAARWLAIRMDWLSVAIILVVSLYLVATTGDVDPVVAGISLTYSLMLTSVVQQVVRSADRTDTVMTSVERLLHFRNIPAEDDSGDASGPQINTELWPSRGAIQFTQLCMKYRPELPLVLRGVTMAIAGGETVGICGRTGAGKSSLMAALFRLCAFESGTIAIDGVDIQRVCLRDLRRSLAIIPQDPVLFSGSLRDNLDPFRTYTDAAIWAVLELAHLAPTVRTWGVGLAFAVSESGENLSVGQRQLLCIARALLKDSKIAVLDEATASVDSATDALIQATITHAFAAKTVLVIAHRIHTILHCDKIAVLAAGRVVEFGAPAVLLATPDSVFASLARRSTHH